MSTLVLYHASCTDGAGAMWSAWKHFGDSVEYIAVGKHSKDRKTTMKKCFAADRIFMCDMMLYKETIVELLDAGVELHLLDHHVTSMNNVLGFRVMKEKQGGRSVYFNYDWQTGDITYMDDELPFTNIPNDSIRNVSISVLEEKYPGLVHDFCDMSRSGAGLTWDHFHGGHRPIIIDYIEDFDLWHWGLPDGDGIHAYLSEFNWRNNQLIIDQFTKFEQMTAADLAAKGRPLLEFKNLLIEKNLGQVGRALVLGKYNVPILNTNHFISETGNYMAKGEPFAVLWQLTNEGAVRISLRSADDGEDLPPIVSQLGENGGGHVHAAGTSYKSFEAMTKQIKFLK